MAYDAYGLHHAADKPDREGHSISMMGAKDAAAAIKELHRKFQDNNTLLSWAVNPDMRVAFDHWRGEAQGKDSSGVDRPAMPRQLLQCVMKKGFASENSRGLEPTMHRVVSLLGQDLCIR